MSSFLKICRDACLPAQKQLESWLPGIPEDTVWAVVKSSIYSFSICVILVKRNFVAGAKSAGLAALVTLIYALFCKMSKYGWWFLGASKEKTIRHEFFLISVGMGIVLGGRMGSQFLFPPTFFATGVPYALTYEASGIPLVAAIFR